MNNGDGDGDVTDAHPLPDTRTHPGSDFHVEFATVHGMILISVRGMNLICNRMGYEFNLQPYGV